MNSEKVKEIKKALEDNKTDHFPYIDGWKCKFVEYADILTLINELESENEELKQSAKNLAYVNEQIIKRNEELKEYIKGNEQDAKAFVNGWHKDLETELKQFAEKLKEISCEMYLKEQLHRCIDETLKEFIGE